MYLAAVIDPAWSKQLLLVERAHWLFIAKLLSFGSKDLTGEQVDPLSQKKPTPDLSMPILD
jgi:hypothetical protein